MDTIFIVGTAGSGKSLLTSRLLQWYKDNNNIYATSLNLDPGAISLPYEPDIDVRDYIDINTLMERYSLGPNGSLIMASDMIASKLDEIQEEVDNINPDLIIIDSPGQIELFAFRASGPYFMSNFKSDNKTTIFTFDGVLVSSPINYVSISLLAASVKLRLGLAQINVLTKRDMVIENLQEILEWADSDSALELALGKERNAEQSLLSLELMKNLSKSGFAQNIIAVSSTTLSGMVNLSAALSRIMTYGDEIKE